MGGKPSTALSDATVESTQETRLKHRYTLSRRRLFVVGILLVLIIAAGVVIWFVSQPTKNTKKQDAAITGTPVKIVQPDQTDQLPSDYTVMTSEQVAERLKKDTGLDLNTLKTARLSIETFKDFDQAYEAAQALYAVQAYAQSAVAYKLAAAIVPSNVNYKFYLDYADVAAYQKDMGLVIDLMQKAKVAVQADNSLSSVTKQDVSNKLDQKIKALQRDGENR